MNISRDSTNSSISWTVFSVWGKFSYLHITLRRWWSLCLRERRKKHSLWNVTIQWIFWKLTCRNSANSGTIIGVLWLKLVFFIQTTTCLFYVIWILKCKKSTKVVSSTFSSWKKNAISINISNKKETLFPKFYQQWLLWKGITKPFSLIFYSVSQITWKIIAQCKSL